MRHRRGIQLTLTSALLAITGAARTLAAQTSPDWTEPFPPFRIAGHLYYIGSKGLASYLITTSQGHILINSSLAESVPLIRASVEKLGFRFRDIKVLLISHAHWDHDAGSAAVKSLTGAKYMVMDGDVPVVESGGANDFHYGENRSMRYPPTIVDRVLHDGDSVKVGDAVLVARLTPGHTKGCTTWTMQLQDGGKTFNVVIVGSPNVNPGYRLVDNTQYPQIATDYERMFRVLKALPADIFLGAHGSYFDLEAKYSRLKQGSPSPFLDRQGYEKFVDEKEQAFRAELAKQSASGKQSGLSTIVRRDWTEVWSDEFEGASGAGVDTVKWRADSADGCQIGICGWGNQEKQFYSSARENVALDGQGHLMLVARRAPAGLACYYGPCRYTSAKITTRGKLNATPGLVTARIKLPAGQGLWPAFWMLGATYPGTAWPLCGELDVMENHGSQPATTSSAIHGPGYSGKTPFSHPTTLQRGKLSDDFHTFSVAWDSLQVRFFVDDTLHYAVQRRDVERYGTWVFDQPFFVLLNLAVGGTFDGDPTSDAILPATMLVDYVRAYAPAKTR